MKPVQKVSSPFDLPILPIAKTLLVKQGKKVPYGDEDSVLLLSNDGRQYLVQEYIEGENLEQELQSEGVFNEEKIKHLLLEILPILDFIHAKRVIHRDIKPANIIRRRSDNKIILVDFGASKFMPIANLSLTGTVIGSPGYIAPEQSNGKAINSSDLYSLGVTCIYLLTGISPFEL